MQRKRLLHTDAANLSELDLFEDLSQLRRQRQKELQFVPHQEESACANTDCLANSRTATACSRLTVGKSSKK